jgi:glycosyltransferase involved in cell wall biosynthesis
MKRINLHIYPSPFRFESRILKETKSLIDLNLIDQIIIASTWEKGLLFREDIYSNISLKRFKLFSGSLKKNPLFDLFKYFEFILRVFWCYRAQNIAYINCHSLLVLPIGVLLKKFGKTQILIYDAHELETERVGLKGTAQKITKWLEKNLIGYVDETIVVCEPIADWYRKTYGLDNIHVIQNMPYRYVAPFIQSNKLKEKYNIPKDNILFIYQGILEEFRGVNTLIDVFVNAPPDKHIVFMGYGTSEKYIKKMSNVHPNIHFHPAVSPSQIIEYTSSADIGIFFIEGDLCLSYQYSLPNKFGEYILAGLPVLVSMSLSYLTEIVSNNKCGWSLDSSNNVQLTQFIISINWNSVNLIKSGVTRYAKTIGWEEEEKKLPTIYQKKKI